MNLEDTNGNRKTKTFLATIKALLNHFRPIFSFYSPEMINNSLVFRRNKKGSLARNALIIKTVEVFLAYLLLLTLNNLLV